jgi:haloalkane dehalogenase
MTHSLALAAALTPSWLDRSLYPFAPHFAQLSDGQVHYVDEGNGEPIVFVHGTPTWSFEYRNLVRELSRSHRCIAIDHLGFGLSQRPDAADYSPEAHVRRFAEFMEQLSLERCTLVVHDYGGPIALPWAVAQRDRVQRLVLLNTWLAPFDGDAQMVRRARFAASFLGRLLYRWFNASLRLIMPSAYGDRSRLTRSVHEQYLRVFEQRDARERVLHALARGLLDARAHYAKLWDGRAQLAAIPSLIVWGLADSALPPRYLEQLRAALPHARVLALPAVGHWPHEEAPDQVLDAICAFVAVAARPRTTALSATSSAVSAHTGSGLST